MSNVRIAILGNSFASKVQLPALRRVGGNEVIGIAGANGDKARATAAKWEIAVGTADYRELLDLEPDLVLISTPVHLHAPMVRDVLETSAAILCEKPFALDEAEAEEMCERAEGRAAWIDHQLRWNPCRKALRTLLAERWLGDLWHVEMDFTLSNPNPAARGYSWWYDRKRGGGILGALGSHMIDLLRSELGEVTTVRCQLDTFVPERMDASGVSQPVTADEHARVSLKFEDGVRADLVTSSAVMQGRDFHTRYTGSEGTLVIEREEILLGVKNGASELEPVESAGRLPTADEVDMPDAGPFARALPAFLEDVLAAVREGRTQIDGAPTFEDGVATQRVLDAARASHAQDGVWVPLG